MSQNQVSGNDIFRRFFWAWIETANYPFLQHSILGLINVSTGANAVAVNVSVSMDTAIGNGRQNSIICVSFKFGYHTGSIDTLS